MTSNYDSKQSNKHETHQFYNVNRPTALNKRFKKSDWLARHSWADKREIIDSNIDILANFYWEICWEPTNLIFSADPNAA